MVSKSEDEDHELGTDNVTTTALVCRDVKSSAVVKYCAVQAPAKFMKLTRNIDLKLPPENWLRETDQWQVLKGCWASTTSSSTLFKSLLMANDFPDCIGEVDVVSEAENIKKLLKMPYSKSHVSMMVHCVGKTLLLDDFDVHRHLLRMAKKEWAWLRKFFLEDIVQSLHKNANSILGKDRSRGHLQHKNMLSKFLYYSIADTLNVCNRMEAAPSERQAGSPNSMAHSSSPPSASGGSAATPASHRSSAKAFEPDEDGEDFFSQDHFCQRNVLWTFEDIRMLIGTDMPIFGGGVHPCVSLRLRDITKPINVLTGLDYWLDNLMCNVPEVMMCYHLNGIVQKYELIKTEDIPKLDNSKFSPIVIKDIAQNILSFLKSNATKAGHTYWLFKAKEGDVVKLYDLTSLCDDMQGGNEQNPYSTPVAMLLYRVARNMKTSLGRDKRRLSTMCTLLENCLNLLDYRRHPQVVTTARYLLSDIYVPSNMDLSSPSTPPESEDEEEDHEDREGAASPPAQNETLVPEREADTSSSMDVKLLCRPENHQSASFAGDRRLPSSSAPIASTVTLVERCRAALQHIEMGLSCLENGGMDDWATREEKEEEETNDFEGISERSHASPRRSSVREEVQKQAKSFQAIPLHYEPLGNKASYDRDGNECGDKSVSGTDLPLASSPSTKFSSARDGQAWQSVYRKLLIEKASLVAYVIAHCSCESKKYGEALRYLEMAFRSHRAQQEMPQGRLDEGSQNPNNSLLAHMLGLAGDVHFMLVQHADKVTECRTEFQKAIGHELIITYMRRIFDGEDEFAWATVFHDQMEDNLVASMKCYRAALDKSRDQKLCQRLQKRYGNVKNELGVYLMNQAHALFNAKVDEGSEEQLESLWKSSFDNLQTGAKIFEDIRDEANVALLNCNLGRLMRTRAICGSSKEFSAKELSFCEKAIWYYLRALRAVGDNKEYATIRESISWDLSSTYFMTGTLMQDYAPLSTRSQEEIEREINELMLKALKHCQWESPGLRQPIYQYRAANIYHRLGSLHHNTFRTFKAEGRKKQQHRSLAESYLGKAADLFLQLEESAEFLKVQLERISIQELQLTNKQPAVTSRLKICHAIVDLVLESIPILTFVVREHESKRGSPTTVTDVPLETANELAEDDGNVTTDCTVKGLLDLLQQRLQFVLLNAVRLMSSSMPPKKGATQEATFLLASYKKMYGEALKLSTSSAVRADALICSSLLEVLTSIQSIYNSLVK